MNPRAACARVTAEMIDVHGREMLRPEVRPEAELDALEAALWYDSEREGLGTEFLGELRATFTRIEEGPARFPLAFREFRRAIFHRFPFEGKHS